MWTWYPKPTSLRDTANSALGTLSTELAQVVYVVAEKFPHAHHREDFEKLQWLKKIYVGTAQAYLSHKRVQHSCVKCQEIHQCN